MKDYEANFYLPLKGVEKPIYAVPGNHDWFNALDGFAANLMHPTRARAAIDARVEADLSLSSTTDDRIDRLIADAARLRALYRVPAGQQHGPFFELHARRVLAHRDRHRHRARASTNRQLAWLQAALERGRRCIHHGHSRPSVLRVGPRSAWRRLVRAAARSAALDAACA